MRMLQALDICLVSWSDHAKGFYLKRASVGSIKVTCDRVELYVSFEKAAQMSFDAGYGMSHGWCSAPRMGYQRTHHSIERGVREDFSSGRRVLALGFACKRALYASSTRAHLPAL